MNHNSIFCTSSVCTENSVLTDYVIESPNISGDDRSVMLFLSLFISWLLHRPHRTDAAELKKVIPEDKFRQLPQSVEACLCDMACSSSLAPLASFASWRGRSTPDHPISGSRITPPELRGRLCKRVAGKNDASRSKFRLFQTMSAGAEDACERS
jgi:hypothetical protein